VGLIIFAAFWNQGINSGFHHLARRQGQARQAGEKQPHRTRQRHRRGMTPAAFFLAGLLQDLRASPAYSGD